MVKINVVINPTSYNNDYCTHENILHSFLPCLMEVAFYSLLKMNSEEEGARSLLSSLPHERVLKQLCVMKSSMDK